MDNYYIIDENYNKTTMRLSSRVKITWYAKFWNNKIKKNDGEKMTSKKVENYF